MAGVVGFLSDAVSDVVGGIQGRVTSFVGDQISSVTDRGIPGAWRIPYLPAPLGWRSRLRPASFRGVPFYVTEAAGEGGRRVALFEFPQRDTPYAEDLGRKQRLFNIVGYVLGNRYPDVRDRLITACEAPGPGALIHPYIGEVQVVCTSLQYREAEEEGAIARFQIAFAESGTTRAPDVTVVPAAGVMGAASNLWSQAKAAFSGIPAPASTDGWGTIERGGATRTD